MEKRVKEAVTVLAKTYGSVTAAASLWSLSPEDVQQALLEVKPDSVEYYILTLLAQSNPTVPVVVPAVPVIVPVIEATVADSAP